MRLSIGHRLLLVLFVSLTISGAALFGQTGTASLHGTVLAGAYKLFAPTGTSIGNRVS